MKDKIDVMDPSTSPRDNQFVVVDECTKKEPEDYDESFGRFFSNGERLSSQVRSSNVNDDNLSNQNPNEHFAKSEIKQGEEDFSQSNTSMEDEMEEYDEEAEMYDGIGLYEQEDAQAQMNLEEAEQNAAASGVIPLRPPKLNTKTSLKHIRQMPKWYHKQQQRHVKMERDNKDRAIIKQMSANEKLCSSDEDDDINRPTTHFLLRFNKFTFARFLKVGRQKGGVKNVQEEDFVPLDATIDVKRRYSSRFKNHRNRYANLTHTKILLGLKPSKYQILLGKKQMQQKFEDIKNGVRSSGAEPDLPLSCTVLPHLQDKLQNPNRPRPVRPIIEHPPTAAVTTTQNDSKVVRKYYTTDAHTTPNNTTTPSRWEPVLQQCIQYQELNPIQEHKLKKHKKIKNNLETSMGPNFNHNPTLNANKSSSNLFDGKPREDCGVECGVERDHRVTNCPSKLQSAEGRAELSNTGEPRRPLQVMNSQQQTPNLTNRQPSQAFPPNARKPPPNYTCYKCRAIGQHFIRACPLQNQPTERKAAIHNRSEPHSEPYRSPPKHNNQQQIPTLTNGRTNNSSVTNERKPPPNYTCYKCRAIGQHFIGACPVQNKNQHFNPPNGQPVPFTNERKPPPNYTCYKCRAIGQHFIGACPVQNKRQHFNPPNGQPVPFTNERKPPPNYTCYKCRAIGQHFIGACPVQNKRQHFNPPNGQPVPFTNERKPPPNYTCYKCRAIGQHFIGACPVQNPKPANFCLPNRGIT